MVDEVAAPAIAETAALQPAILQTPAPAAVAFEGPEWLTKFPDDVKTDKSLWKYTSEESAARGLINAQRMIGMEKIAKPKGDFDLTNPDWQAYLDVGGRPKSAEEYKFPEAKLPEGMEYDSGLEDKFKSVFHGAGLNPKQAQMLRDAFVAHQGEGFTSAQLAYKQSRDEASVQLQKEMGAEYEPTVNAAKAGMKEFMSENLVKRLDETGFGNDPEMVRTFSRIGKELLGETKLKALNEQAQMSTEQLRDQIGKFRVQNETALFDRSHPDNERLTKELTQMTQLAFPEPKR